MYPKRWVMTGSMLIPDSSNTLSGTGSRTFPGVNALDSQHVKHYSLPVDREFLVGIPSRAIFRRASCLRPYPGKLQAPRHLHSDIESLLHTSPSEHLL